MDISIVGSYLLLRLYLRNLNLTGNLKFESTFKRTARNIHLSMSTTDTNSRSPIHQHSIHLRQRPSYVTAVCGLASAMFDLNHIRVLVVRMMKRPLTKTSLVAKMKSG